MIFHYSLINAYVIRAYNHRTYIRYQFNTNYSLFYIFIYRIAKCLGALTVAPECLKWLKMHTFHPVLLNDEEAVSACIRFAGIIFYTLKCIFDYYNVRKANARASIA